MLTNKQKRIGVYLIGMALLGVIGKLMGASVLAFFSSAALAKNDAASPGQLAIVNKQGDGGLCPLNKTKVNANITGFGARVTVVQEFVNPSKEAIEAVYTFPLPHDSAVDRMRMKIGDRIVEGDIKRREEARAIYEAAKQAGQTASLLDQERDNIFTQNIANIMPGAKIEIEISYVQLLKYEEGQFEFNYPMVVGPRYLPNAPDAQKINPPITPKGTRTGTTIELTVSLDAGAPITSLKSVLHDVDIAGKVGQNSAQITLKKKDEIPNKDFILRYQTATGSVQSAFMSHMDPNEGGFFQLILLPPKAVKTNQIAKKEIVFLIDQSGSQQRFPIEKSKELMLKLVDKLHPGDTFNVASFSNTVNWLWPNSKQVGDKTLSQAKTYIKALSGDGGTEMLQAIRAVFHKMSTDPDRLPIMIFSTDGYVGDDREIIKAVKAEAGRTRIFTFGIGNAVNRFLIDNVSKEARGDAEFITLQESADEAVDRFIRRLETPVLTDIDVRVDGVSVSQMLPSRIPDVFSDQPIMVCGRYSKSGSGMLTVSGKVGGQPWTQSEKVDFSDQPNASSIPTLWARRQVDDLTLQTPDSSGESKSVKERIIDVALRFGIMSEFTSFVAVEKRVVNIGGKQRLVEVPVEMPEGVSYEGIFGADKDSNASKQIMHAGVYMGKAKRRSMSGVSQGMSGRYAAADAASELREVPEPVTIANGEKINDNAKAVNYTRKVSKKLHNAKGNVEIQILVKAISSANLEKLAALGLKVYQADKGIKVVFGQIDAKKLLGLAQLDFVKLVSPL